nr:hypothetical protein [Thauera sp. K11]
MPKGGFGNLIALPLQKWPRERGCSVFVDAELRPYPDQWAFLASIQPMAAQDIEPIVLRATGGAHPLDVTFIDDEDLATPWKRESTSTRQLQGPMPKSLTVTLANLVYFEKSQLPQALANRLIRLAAFQNPEFYKAQAMRMSVWDKPRVVGNAENYPQHIALPRGCIEAALDLLRENGISCELRDERFGGEPLEVSFAGTLRLDQEAAASVMRNRPSNPVPRRCRGLQRSTTCLSSPNDTRQPGSFSQSTLAVFWLMRTMVPMRVCKWRSSKLTRSPTRKSSRVGRWAGLAVGT